jgi:DNA-binding winged helix-turn-helix (wHTH) protein
MRLLFNDFCLDRATRQLLRDGRERHLEPKAFELLELLVLRRPEAVSKSEIQERLWPDTFVSESNLSGLVAQIRRALGDGAQEARFVRTLHGFGYAFAVEAREEGAAPAAPSPAVRPSAGARVLWRERVFALGQGENVLGRAEEATVQIEAPGVSRLHARVVVGQGEATIEDLGSKNGTFLREERLVAPGVLRDGDTFRLGGQLLIFRIAQSGLPTDTEIGAPGGSS